MRRLFAGFLRFATYNQPTRCHEGHKGELVGGMVYSKEVYHTYFRLECIKELKNSPKKRKINGNMINGDWRS